MSIVLPAIDGADVVDLCAGSGALGLEALSRGAKHCDFVESDAKVLRVLRENIDSLGASARSTVHKRSAVDFVEQPPVSTRRRDDHRWELAFADPPYANDLAARLAGLWLRRPFATIFCVEHAASLTLPDADAPCTVNRRRYGDTALTIYRTGT